MIETRCQRGLCCIPRQEAVGSVNILDNAAERAFIDLHRCENAGPGIGFGLEVPGVADLGNDGFHDLEGVGSLTCVTF